MSPEIVVPRNIRWKVEFEKVNRPSPAANAVTVAVSLYNYEQFITECLATVAQSDHHNIELVVVDDASTKDDSVAVAARWMERSYQRFGRVTMLVHEYNQGLAEARNTAFSYARTDPVFVMDADNHIYPRALRRLHDFVAYRGFDAAYSQLEWFGDIKRLGFADIWDRSMLSRGNYIDAMAMISKRAWESVGGYSHIEGGWEDFDLWCKFMESGLEVIYVPEILCRYRVHGNSMISTDTLNSENRLTVELTTRHPWLKLRTKRPKVLAPGEHKDPRVRRSKATSNP